MTGGSDEHGAPRSEWAPRLGQLLELRRCRQVRQSVELPDKVERPRLVRHQHIGKSGTPNDDEAGVERPDALDPLHLARRDDWTEPEQPVGIQQPPQRGLRDTVQPLDAVGWNAGKVRYFQQLARCGQGGERFTSQLKGPAPGSAESRPHLSGLRGRAPSTQNRPGRRLVGRIEQRWTESRRRLLQPPDHRIPVAHRPEVAAVMIERETAGHLPSDRVQITGAVDGTMHARAVLPEFYANLVGVAVEAKCQAHNTIETVVGRARPLAAWHPLTKPEQG